MTGNICFIKNPDRNSDGDFQGTKCYFLKEIVSKCGLPQLDRTAHNILGRISALNVRWPRQIEADLIRTAMLRLDRLFRRRNMKARIVMMIHDCIWVEAAKAEESQLRHLMQKMMTTAGKLSVPLEIDFE